MMGIRTLHYHGNQISRQVGEDTTTTLLVKAGDVPLILTDVVSGATTTLKVGVAVTLARGKSTIQLSTD